MAMSDELTLIKFTNCRIVRDHQLIEDDIWVRNGIIVNPQHVFYIERKSFEKIVDLQGAIVSPGFIDIQINGGFGIDFSYDLIHNPDLLSAFAKKILAHGVTAFCPTLVTSKTELYHKILPLIPKRPGGVEGAEVLGVHVEGPFISPEKKGAHSLDRILDFTHGVETFREVYKYIENIKVVTLAPEKKNSLDVIKYLVDKNITVSLGHSMADIHVAEAAVTAGAKLITHLFNAMLPFHHRDPGLVGLLGSECGMIYYGIISDGVHTHPNALKIAYNAHPKGAILVSDAISAMGLEEGTHHLGEKVVQISGNRACIANTNTLCGSIMPLDKCIKYFKNAVGCSLVEALEAATLHPAKALDIDAKKGTLNYGADADFVVLSEDCQVKSTWIKGICVFQNDQL